MTPPRRVIPAVSPPPRFLRTGDEKTDTAVGALGDDVRRTLEAALTRAVRVTPAKVNGRTPDRCVFSVGDLVFLHPLGRVPQGWLISRPLGAAIAAGVYETKDPDDKRLYLTSVASGRADIWVW